MRQIQGKFEVTLLGKVSEDTPGIDSEIIKAAVGSFALGFAHQLTSYLGLVFKSPGVSVFPIKWEVQDESEPKSDQR